MALPQANKYEALAGVVLAGQVLDLVAGRSGLTGAELRVLGLIGALGVGGRIVNTADVARMYDDRHGTHTKERVVVLLRLGLIGRERRRKGVRGLVVLPAGLHVLGLLAREERAVRRKVREYNSQLPVWPRPYERSAKWYESRGLPVPAHALAEPRRKASGKRVAGRVEPAAGE